MKVYKNIIIFAVIILVLGAVYFCVSNIEPEVINENEAPKETISIFKTDPQNITYFYTKNENEEYTLIKENGEWKILGVGDFKVEQERVEVITYRASELTAQALISESKDVSQYGLDEPGGIISIKMSSGDEITVYIGDKTLDGSCYYILLNEKVYTVLTSAIDNLAMSYYLLADNTLYSFLEYDLERISIYKRGNDILTLENDVYVTAEGVSANWTMTEPIKANVEKQYLSESFMPQILSLSHSKFADSDSVNNYGFNDPYAKISFYTKEGELVVTIGDEKDGFYYIKTSDDDMVYMIKKEALSFLDVGYFTLAEKLVHVENIYNINGVKFSSKTESVELVHVGENDAAIYKINDREIDERSYKSAYQAIIGITLDGYKKDAGAGEVLYEIVYDKKDGTKTTVSFVQIDERNCIAKINGEGILTVKNKHLEEVMDRLKEIYNSNLGEE